ncbi:hypothetical protein ACFY7Y_33705 [Streptomyces virginiae]|uniref:hypothetical protein n=1 Tax=Streptomyces TaxID=1883 RepID=UPI002E2C179A|nr:hypothetical protein [Streptomyces sp. NBC_00239]WSX96974.1 hypothetical protein OG590_06780 [Streptomyces goshikiensis]
MITTAPQRHRSFSRIPDDRPRPTRRSAALSRDLARAVLALRRHLSRSAVPLAGRISRARAVGLLSTELGLPEELTSAALAVLEQRGDVFFSGRGRGVSVVGPGMVHPDDAVITAYLETAALSYGPGDALPMGLIAHDCQVPVAHVRRASRPLIVSGLLQFRPRGPHGPGLYVREPSTATREPDRSGAPARAKAARHG